MNAIAFFVRGWFVCSVLGTMFSVDPSLAEKVPVVLRVRMSENHVIGSRFPSEEVELLETIKNDSSYQFPKRFELGVTEVSAAYGDVLTIYMKRASLDRDDLWSVAAYSNVIHFDDADTTQPIQFSRLSPAPPPASAFRDNFHYAEDMEPIQLSLSSLPLSAFRLPCFL